MNTGSLLKLHIAWYLGIKTDQDSLLYTYFISLPLLSYSFSTWPSNCRYGHLTWEWKRGIRSYLHPLLFAVLYKFLAFLHLDTPWFMVISWCLFAFANHDFLFYCVWIRYAIEGQWLNDYSYNCSGEGTTFTAVYFCCHMWSILVQTIWHYIWEASCKVDSILFKKTILFASSLCCLKCFIVER